MGKKPEKEGASSEFIEARRSIRLSPCQPNEDAVKLFLEKELGMDRDVVESISLVEVRPFIPRKPRKPAIKE